MPQIQIIVEGSKLYLEGSPKIITIGPPTMRIMLHSARGDNYRKAGNCVAKGQKISHPNETKKLYKASEFYLFKTLSIGQ